MKTPWLSIVCGLALAACAATETSGEPPAPDEPLRVLLLGDSISIGYTAEVRRLLGDGAVVVRPTQNEGKNAENCAGTTKGVEHIDRWLALEGGDWDVIHFNFGLHDLKRVDAETGKNSIDPNDPHQADPATYGAQLREIHAALAATDARLIFATTTPVPEGGVRPHREPSDVGVFNAVALAVFVDQGVQVNDLYAFALPRLAEIQQPVNVHFSPEGSVALAEEVARAILHAAGRPEELVLPLQVSP